MNVPPNKPRPGDEDEANLGQKEAAKEKPELEEHNEDDELEPMTEREDRLPPSTD
jgi:hypothetical protein